MQTFGGVSAARPDIKSCWKTASLGKSSLSGTIDLERRLADILEIARTTRSMILEGFVSDRLGKMILKRYLFANGEENEKKPSIFKIIPESSKFEKPSF
jgi:hypothetical protein